MPAAVPLAIVGSSVIGAAASSSAAKKTSQAATQTAQTNNALQQGIYNANSANMQPFLAGGNNAFASWQDAMGLNAGRPAQSALPAPGSAALAYGTGQQGGSVSYGGRAPRGAIERRVAEMGDGMVYDGTGGGNALSPGQFGPAVQVSETSQQPANALNPGNALSAFDQFKSSTGYQTNLTEGMRAQNLAAGNRGLLESGGATRDAIRFGQDLNDRTFQSWMDRLMQGTQIGAGAANALAGVGTNYGNAVSANNNNALNATANANTANANAITGLAGNAGAAAAYYYGNRADPAKSLSSSYGGSGRPIFWG